MTTEDVKDDDASEGQNQSNRTNESSNKAATKSQEQSDSDVKWRSKYKSTKEELESFQKKSETEKQELNSRFEETTKAKSMYEQKYIDSELKAQAVAAGIKDIEFVKLIDKADIKLNENGSVEGIEKAITSLKERKPEWFGAEKKTSSSTNASFPDQQKAAKPVDARSLSKEDWQKNKSKFMAGRF